MLFPNESVIDTEYFNVHQDWEVPIPAFFIIASKRKIRSISEFTGREALEFFNLLAHLRRGMKDVLGINDVYLFQNEDTSHNFHMWVFPRHRWMDKFGSKIQSVRPIIEYAKENMATDEVIKDVKECVKKMSQYMQSS